MSNIARDSGNTTLMQMWLPGLGGPMNPEFDFVAAHVGTNAAELMERLDLFRDGYRSLALWEEHKRILALGPHCGQQTEVSGI